MLEIVLASSNKGKINEINQLMKDHGIRVVSQSEYGVDEVEETGSTFIENALLKARHATSIAKLPSLADDSGLVVPILNDDPGIYSARYAGPQANHAKNMAKLLDNLKDIPQEQRNAYFYCVIVLLRHPSDPCPIVSEGIWHGRILSSPQGEWGFGYDPIFFDTQYECSAAQLPLEIKNTISHRGQAMRKLLERM